MIDGLGLNPSPNLIYGLHSLRLPRRVTSWTYHVGREALSILQHPMARYCLKIGLAWSTIAGGRQSDSLSPGYPSISPHAGLLFDHCEVVSVLPGGIEPPLTVYQTVVLNHSTTVGWEGKNPL